jgi:hypothetical protein
MCGRWGRGNRTVALLAVGVGAVLENFPSRVIGVRGNRRGRIRDGHLRRTCVASQFSDRLPQRRRVGCGEARDEDDGRVNRRAHLDTPEKLWQTTVELERPPAASRP